LKFVQKIFVSFALVVLFGTAYALAFVNPQIDEAPFSAQNNAPENTNTFPVKNPQPNRYEDLNKRYPMDVPNPDNVTESVDYDPSTGVYFFKTKVGDQEVVTPMSMTEEQYLDYSMKESMRNYWREKTKAENDENRKKSFSLTDMQINIGGADKVFGPGGVQIKMQGSAELMFGFKTNKVQNPTLSERLRNPPPIFDFSEKIQLNVNGKVGDRVNFGMNYNTEASFDYDQSKIKLAYEGKEDDIIKRIEAGNVSMPLNSSLIKGSASLFGIKTELQFGKLSVAAILSQQESESKSISLKNGAQTTDFRVDASDYDENRHFFLATYFRENYEKSMSRLPYINSSVHINRIEVWITNKRANYDQSRNILGFVDLGETDGLNNTFWTVQSTQKYPFNRANNLYDAVAALFPNNLRPIDKLNQTMENNFVGNGIDGGEDYETLESARKLDPSEYVLNPQLGYISLRTQLNADDILAVAYEYTVNGKTYQVGEFSTDGIESPNALLVKMLKGSSHSPALKNNWDLMMKNVYALGGAQVQQEDFKLEVMYQSDSSGVYINYMPEGKVKDQSLLKVFKLDRLNQLQQLRPDGVFDYVDGFTIIPSSGRVIFPVLEPFGSDLAEALGVSNGDPLYDKYVFQELYTESKTQAKQITEKNKFELRGEYKASSSSEIRLNALNVPKGSVFVRAGGMLLTENIDYTVDYTMGTITIINEAILESGGNIDVSMESQTMFSMQRKSLTGVHLEYEFNKNLSVGSTLMHYSEKPLTTKVNLGDEPMSNTIWGANLSYKKESQLITNLLDKLPLLNVKAPSLFTFNGEFAQLIPGHPSVVGKQGMAYIDDFESAKSSISVLSPYAWFLASTPEGTFPEAKLIDDVAYGKNRALFAWYTIDPLFTQNSTMTPSHIRNDKEQLSDNRVREIREQEIFPNRETVAGQVNTISVLNLSYYPSERGPYNLDAENINPDGSLQNPEKRWGGMMRKMDVTDFEAANIEFLEFWMMDPFGFDYSPTTGGDLYFNFGDISEDILKDGKKAFENGLPINGDTTKTARTVWGRTAKTQSTVYAFDNDASARQYQDVGLDGLRTEDEFEFDTYKKFLADYKAKITNPAASAELQNDPFSALNDPAGDNYHYYRGSDLDDRQATILERYKYYNGMEGNSPVSGNSTEYSSAASNIPNIEDVNQDNTLSQYEKYLQVRVPIKPDSMSIGINKYITDRMPATVTLKNGKTETVYWCQFKVPLNDLESPTGRQPDFRSIRFMRMFMTGFSEETHLRFATLELVRGDWRVYDKAIYGNENVTPTDTSGFDISVINIEENASKTPVNYVLPPGISREQDPSQTQVIQENEQAIMLKVQNLRPNEARAIYKNTSFDLRQFKRLQLFVHAEALENNPSGVRNDELTAFVRIGSDLTENYYEYEVSLQLTPPGNYGNNNADRETVWPVSNMLDFPISVLTDVKTSRNKQRRPMSQRYSERIDDNRVTIKGNPTLSDVQHIMIGVRNQSSQTRSGEVWVNELRMVGFNEEGGHAGMANAMLTLSDFGSVSVGGRYESSGFGAIDDNLADRRMDDFTQINVATSLELGKLFPEKAKVRLPMFYSYSRDVSKPKYDPYNEDLRLEQTLDAAASEAERDSIEDYANTVYTTKSINFTNVRVDIRSKRPMPYDPANFAFTYAYTESNQHDPDTKRFLTKDYKGAIDYLYPVNPKPWEPLKKIRALNKPSLKLISDFNIYYLPMSVAYSTNLTRQYSEKQLRNFNNPEISYNDPNNPLLSNSKMFMWSRRFDLKYDLTRALKFSYSSSNNSQIEETRYSAVNRELFPTEYQNWKDTVWNSLLNGGVPLAFQQMVTMNYSVPFNKIPMLSWITAGVNYNGNYTWDRGALTQEDEEAGRQESSMGNNITSLGTWQVDGRFMFEQLYNKSSFLKRVNQRFSSRNNATPNRNNANNAQADEKKNANFQQTVKLEKGKKVRISHRLNSDRVRLTASDDTGKPYKLRYRVIDRNSIEIIPRENIAQTKISVDALPAGEIPLGQNILEYSARALMSIRNFSFNYNQSNGMTISGYKPATGLLGQDASAPGLLFTLGYQEPHFMQKAYESDWLVSDSTINAAGQTYTSDLTVKMALEPIAGLKIDLGVQRNYAHQRTIEYMFDMKTNTSGTFSMTTIALRSLFKSSGNAKNNYHSPVFEEFKANRYKVLAMLEARYSNMHYPTGGFIGDLDADPARVKLGGQAYATDPNRKAFSLNSAEVLIPAFYSTYTGTSLGSGSFDLIPSLLKMLPNWRISYDGLNRIAFIKEHFKSVNLTHAYTCKYNVGGFISNATWIGADGDYGFAPDVTDGLPRPAMIYDVPVVSITENFSPLIRVDMTLKNSITFSTEYRKGRTMGMNITSAQLVESSNGEYVIGAGYRLPDFNRIIKIRGRDLSVKNDLNLRADFSIRDTKALIRKLDEDGETQATSGDKTYSFQFSAEYIFSSKMNFKLFYERQSSSPLISSSYPTTNQNFGFSVKLLLTR
jgi:cell surface protein SprA